MKEKVVGAKSVQISKEVHLKLKMFTAANEVGISEYVERAILAKLKIDGSKNDRS